MSRYLQQLARHAGLGPPGPSAIPASRRPGPTSPPELSEIHEQREASAPAADPMPAAAPVFAPAAMSGANIPLHAAAEPREQRPAQTTTTPGVQRASQPEAAYPKTSAAAPPSPAAIIQQVVDWIAEPERRKLATPAKPAPAALPDSPAPKEPAIRAQDDEPPPEPAAVEIAVAARPTPAMAMPAHPRAGQRPGSSDRPRATRDAAPDREPPPEFQVSIGSIELTIEPPPPAPPSAPPPTARPAAPSPRATLRTGAYRHYLRATP